MRNFPVNLARLWLLQGGVIAYPTEAVFGLGCDPWNQHAVERLLAIKQRPMEKGLILVAASTQQFAALFEKLSDEQRRTLNASWPGPITWLIPDPDNLIPPWIKGHHTSVGIRVSAHPLVKELCQSFGAMIVSTSANLAEKREIRSRLRLEKTLGTKLDYVLPGQLGGASHTSVIKDLKTGKILR